MIALTLTLAIRTVSEANAHEHWRLRQKRAKAQRSTAGVVVLAALREPGRPRVAPPCTVTLTRLAPSNGLDTDNLAGSQKHVRDGIADALGIDDRNPAVTWLYDQQRGPWGVRICIERAMLDVSVRDMPSGPLTAGG